MTADAPPPRARHGAPARSGRPYALELVATGYAYPSLVIDNDAYFARAELEFTTDRPTLIAQTKLKSRRWCAPGETTWTLARQAVDHALSRHPELREQIDLVLVASGTTFPVLQPADPGEPGMADLAPRVLGHLGRADALGIDVKACYCTGFLRCLEVADGMLANPNYRAALVVATEQGSRLATAASNRSSFVFLAADAAGAAVLRRRPPEEAPRARVLDYLNATDPDKLDWVGVGADGLSMIARGSRLAAVTIELLVRAGRTLLERNALSPSEVKWLLPVQTHAQVVEQARAALEWPADRVLWTGDVYGFSGSASIPSCLAEQIERGVVKAGDTVLCIAVGAGLSWAAALLVA